MTCRSSRGRRGAARLVPVLFAGALAAGCSDTPEREAELTGTAGSACGDLPNTPAGLKGPPGMRFPSGSVLYLKSTLGGDLVYQARHPGVGGDVDDLRDRAAAALVRAGYTVSGEEGQPGESATARFAGAQAGTLTVVPLCKGQLVLRYVLTDPAPAGPPTATTAP